MKSVGRLLLNSQGVIGQRRCLVIDDCSPGLSKGREGGLNGCRRASNSVGCFPSVPYQMRMETVRIRRKGFEIVLAGYLVLFLSRSINWLL